MMHVLVSVKIHKGLDVVSFLLVDMELKMSTYKTSDAYIDTFNINDTASYRMNCVKNRSVWYDVT